MTRKLGPANLPSVFVDPPRSKMEIVAALATNSVPAVEKALSGYQVPSTDFSRLFTDLEMVLAAAVKSPAPEEMVRRVLSSWGPSLNRWTLQSTVCLLASLFTFPVHLLKEVMALLKITAYDLLLLELQVPREEGGIFSVVANRLLLTDDSRILRCEETWRSFLEVAQKAGREETLQYLKGRIAAYAAAATLPGWVSRLPVETNLPSAIYELAAWPSAQEEPPSIPRITQDLLELTTVTTNSEGESETVDAGVLEEVATLAASTLPTQSRGELPANPYRIFGPLNSMADTKCPTSWNGSCAMLTCVCREEGDDLEEEAVTSNWFTGNCEECSARIRNLSHSIRLPVNGGGWYGCYCSLECIHAARKGTAPSIEYQQEQEIRIERMMETLSESGIHDRVVEMD